MSGYFADASGTEKDDARGENPHDEPCKSYDDLDAETRTMIDAVLFAQCDGAMHEGDAVRIMVRLGMDKDEAIELLDAEHAEASQP